jgi:cyclophilin family peptidyl-prolyl cis-trans isomerase
MLVAAVALASICPGCAGEEAEQPSGNPAVVFSTTLGDITIELYPEQAPTTVQNFLEYVNAKFYDGTIFHRVIPGFVIQGGGMDPSMQKKETRPPIKNEAANGIKNTRGTVSMARTSVVDSATSQFFISLKDNTSLDHRDTTARGYGYAVFGTVVAGMDVVDKIAKVQTTTRAGHRDVPAEAVIVTSARVVGS